MQKPVMKVIKVDPLTGHIPRVTEVQMKEHIKQELTKPIQFIYEEGIVKKIQYSQTEELWSLNMKKGVMNMMHVDILAGHRMDSLVFNKTEVSTTCDVMLNVT